MAKEVGIYKEDNRKVANIKLIIPERLKGIADEINGKTYFLEERSYYKTKESITMTRTM